MLLVVLISTVTTTLSLYIYIYIYFIFFFLRSLLISLSDLFSGHSFYIEENSSKKVVLILKKEKIKERKKEKALFPSNTKFICSCSSGNEELLNTLVRLHDSLLPSLQRGFRIILKAREDGMISDIAISLKMLSMRIVKFGWNLLEICHLSEEVFEDSFPIPPATKMFPANVEDPVIRADIIVQTFREINGVSLQFQENEHQETFLQNVEKVHNAMSKLESLQNTG
jgi:hypothetical protein